MCPGRNTNLFRVEFMKHTHFWILDKNNFGKCRNCPATKQFPVVSKITLRPSEALTMENLGPDSKCNPDAWCSTSVYGVKFDNDY